MKRIILLTIILLACINILRASTFHGQIKAFKQPDGTMVDLKLFGTEYYMRAEGLDGFTLVRDQKTGWISYARLSEDKTNLISTGIRYHGVQNDNNSLRSDLNFDKHIDITDAARKEIINKNKASLDHTTNEELQDKPKQKTTTTPVGLISGNIRGLCIVVDFSDQVGMLPISEFDSFCNGMNYSNFANNGSLRKFYKDISGGLVDYKNVVFGYFRAPLTFAQYDAMPYAVGAQEILGLALNWLDAQGFDFSTLSINPDGSIKAINLMYTGVPLSWAQGMWHHQGGYTAFSADGVHSDAYNCSPANNPLELAVVAHENGHMICDWPDTYKYTTMTGPDGIGAFDLMSWYGNSHNPVPPNPLFRSNAGWGSIVDVTNYNGLNFDTANSSVCYRYLNVNDTNEFFLLENRMKMGRSTYIPDQGLTIWHIDRNGDNQTTHHEVWLEHADNDYTDEDHACFKNTGNNEYGNSTLPGSTFYNGDPSGLRVWDIGAIGTVMSYKLGLGQPGPALSLTYNNITGDNNGNGSIEPAESANMNVTAVNQGQLQSAAATAKCTAIGQYASFITVNTPSVNLGTMNIGQPIPVAFNITVSPNLPLGTVIQMKFSVTDGTDSIHITRKFTIGQVILMDNTPSTTCTGVFYDEGQESNYRDNSDYTKTFFSTVTGQPVTVDFLNFDVEDQPNCTYDRLMIYDGPNTSSPLLGTYCGIVSPGTITSSHPSGALTFRFISDGAVNYPGWKAIISCPGITTISEPAHTNDVAVSPNPSTGIFNARLKARTEVSFEVVDMLGRSILRKSFSKTDNFHVDLSGQQPGIYFLKMEINHTLVTKKIIVNR